MRLAVFLLSLLLVPGLAAAPSLAATRRVIVKKTVIVPRREPRFVPMHPYGMMVPPPRMMERRHMERY